jgi:hypothetical protein
MRGLPRKAGTGRRVGEAEPVRRHGGGFAVAASTGRPYDVDPSRFGSRFGNVRE